MSKPTLGRGLGDLLGAQHASAKPPAPRPMDVGLRILIDGVPPESENPERAAGPNTSSPEAFQSSLLRVTLVAALGSADVALLGWTAHYVITHKHALEWFGIAGCILSTLIAAACGCAAVLASRISASEGGIVLRVNGNLESGGNWCFPSSENAARQDKRR